MKIVKNYLYNLSYQFLLIILPIITTPYVTRIFTSADLGNYAFYNSIMTYFLLLAGLGVANYGTRLISQNRQQIGDSFWSIYHLQIFASLISITTYLTVISLIPRLNAPIAYLLTLNIISRGIDISWVFQGMEDFRRITIRNTIVKLLGVISIFLFINSPDDLLLYIFFLVGFEFIGQLSMWLPARKLIGKWRWNGEETLKHFRPVLYLFLPQIAVTLYVNLDRSMLGILASAQDVGIYDQAFKIINILLTVVTSLGIVMLPRISKLLSENKEDEIHKLYNMSFLAYNLIIFPIIFGMLVINKDFVSIFLGPDFQDAIYAIAIMLWRLFFIGWTNIMGIQILIPYGRNKEYLISTTVPAVFSLLLNLILITRFGFIGAAITSVFSEMLVWSIQLFATKRQLAQLNIVKPLLKIIGASLFMYIGLIGINNFLHFSAFVNIVISIGVGGILYSGAVFFLKIINLEEIKAIFSNN